MVSFPIDYGDGIRTASSISMWEQLSLAAFLQRHWADNQVSIARTGCATELISCTQVSCTVTFDPATEGPQLDKALNYFQYQLKGDFQNVSRVVLFRSRLLHHRRKLPAANGGWLLPTDAASGHIRFLI